VPVKEKSTVRGRADVGDGGSRYVITRKGDETRVEGGFQDSIELKTKRKRLMVPDVKGL